MNKYRVFGISFRSVGARRLAVAAMYGSFLAGGAFYEIGLRAGLTGFDPARVAAFLLCAAAYIVVYKVTRGYAIRKSYGRNAVHADERQTHVRDRAMAHAYLALSFILVSGVGWAGWLDLPGKDPWWFWRPTHAEWEYLFWLVLLLTSSLPEAMVAWAEPEIEEEFSGLTA